MTEQEDTRRKSRRDLLLVLLILPFGVLCMFMTGQAAIKLAPTWMLEADMRSLLDPNAHFAGGFDPLFIAPLDPGILTLPAWDDLFLTPNITIPTRQIPTATPSPPVRTPQPPTLVVTPIDDPDPTATGGPIILPTPVDPVEADLRIEKSDNSRTYTPGTAINYTILVTNLGPGNANRFDVTDNIPAVISGLSVNCTPANFCGTNTSSGNTISFTGANLSSSRDNQITISVSGRVASGATGNLSNTASVVIPSGVRYIDPNPSNNTVTDTDAQLSVYDLAITKSDGANTYTATSPITYTIVMTNNVGPSDALGVRVTDNKPAQIASWTWTCTTVTNASGCNGVTNSTNNFTDTVNIRVGGRIVYTVTANPANMPPNPLNLSNTARIILPGSPSSIDPNLANNSSTDINIPYIDLQVTKDDGVTTYIPGGTVTYTVTATNNSTFNLTGITVSDPIPDLVTTWSWACASGCTPVTNSSNDFSDTINLPANSSLVYTVTANISGTAGATNLTNTATVGVPAGLVDAVPANNTATDIDGPNIDSIDLQITKTDVPAGNTYTPGGQVRYEVVVTNNSAVNLTGVTVMDNIPPLIDPFSWFWTCAPGPGASCTQGIGLTHLYDTAVSLPPGGSVTYTINATVESFAIGTLENTATVIEPAGFVDAVPGNNTATDINVSLAAEPDIGPPDGDWTTPSEPGSLTFFLNPAIVADGDGNPDFVYYERQASAVRVDLDWVQIEISSDGNVWYQVFYWGDSDPGIPDTNTNMDYVNSINDLCTFEEDNCSIPLGRMYKNSGVTIDVDGIVPQGNYPWIRISSPIVSPDGDAPEVDAIQPYYP